MQERRLQPGDDPKDYIFNNDNLPKTEDLSFQQACAAIGRVECVETRLKEVYSGRGRFFGHHVWTESAMLRMNDAPFQIIPDPSKQVELPPSLTYEQALECEKVRIHWPNECYQTHKGTDPIYIRYQGDYWLVDCMLAFDLAERRGYRMEKMD